eukprot:scaffold101576_cov30-Tisochrysis_lutea.AAC.3
MDVARPRLAGRNQRSAMTAYEQTMTAAANPAITVEIMARTYDALIAEAYRSHAAAAFSKLPSTTTVML